MAWDCFPLDFCINLHIVSLDIWAEQGSYILKMNPGYNPGGSGGYPGPPGGSGGSPLPPRGPSGSQVYARVFDGSNTDSATWVQQNSSAYDPSGVIPPSNAHEVGRLLEYRILRTNSTMDCSSQNFSISRLIGGDNPVNNIAKQIIYAHVFDHKDELPTAYRQLDPLNAPRGARWGKVCITLTSPLMKSLKDSV